MDRSGNIEWSLPDGYTTDQRSKGTQNTRIFSDSFCRDVFCLTCRNSGYRRRDGALQIQFGIILLKMPAKIKKLELKYQLSVYTKTKLSAPKLERKWSRSAVALAGWTMDVLQKAQYKGKVTVKCSIRVIKAFDWD